MNLRGFAVCGACLLGLSGSIGQAWSQYYPPYNAPQRAYPGEPVDVDEDAADQPAIPRAPIPGGYGPGSVAAQPPGSGPLDIDPYRGRQPGVIESAPLSPPVQSGQYGSQPGYAPLPGAPVQQGYSQPEGGGLRPPADIGMRPEVAPRSPAGVANLPPEDQPEVGEPKELPAQFRRQLVDYRTKEPPGTLVIDTPNTFLYLILGNGKALRYGIGVGREGFTWAGTERVSKMAEWPDWHPPQEMIQRQPYLPRFMAGGPGNPLGARALYLGNTLFRIHGTNQPSTIGQFVSSGCVRLVNDDIEDLYSRVTVGTRVVVLPGGKSPTTAAAEPQQQQR
ncbi:MAG TPA: L,D-transpeptidase [Xanthobacteraceae bacterium]|nr:L,D-transpeptidase [Xanthobacteraceae bacterium]